MAKKWVCILLGGIMMTTMAACGNMANSTGSNSQESSVMAYGGSEESSAFETPESTESVEISRMEDSTGNSVVYMTADISPEGLIAVYDALGWAPTGNVAVKLSTGEPPASNYLRPELIADLVQSVNGTIVECNTAYGGSRAETFDSRSCQKSVFQSQIPCAGGFGCQRIHVALKNGAHQLRR